MTQAAKVKHYPEFILAIAREHAEKLFQEGFDRTVTVDDFSKLQEGLVIRQRQWLDFSNNAERGGFNLTAVEEGAEHVQITIRSDKSGDETFRDSIMSALLTQSAHPGGLSVSFIGPADTDLVHTTKIGDDAYRQVLPYVTVRDNDLLLLPYLRGKGVSEGRLEGKVSVAFGGHVDMVDVVQVNSVIDFIATVKLNIQRELEEELVVFVKDSDKPEDQDVPVMSAGELKFNGIINDHSDEVGRLHLGFSFDFVLKAGYSARSREAELRVLPWQSGEGLYDMPGVIVENWSNLYLKG